MHSLCTPVCIAYTLETCFSVEFLYLKKAGADGEQERERFASGVVICSTPHSVTV